MTPTLDPQPVMVRPKRGCAGQMVVVIIVLLALVGGWAAWNFSRAQSLPSTSSPVFDRHGLPDTIPLPSHSSFFTMRQVNISGQQDDDLWVWTVDSPNDPATLRTFYADQLPSQGWTQEQVRIIDEGGSELDYCRGNQTLFVKVGFALHADASSDAGQIDVTAPPGGAVLYFEVRDGCPW